MRDPKRVERILAKIEKVWRMYPDLRLGQMITNLTFTGEDLFNLEDQIIEARIDFLERTGTWPSAQS